MIKIAIIGTGGYAHGLIQNIWELSEKMQLVAACSNPKRNSQGAQACREKGIPVYDHIDEMLDNMQGKADVIMVPTPINTHFQLTKKCLEADFDVFLEKPPVATIQQHDELLSIAKAKGKQVPVMFQTLYTDLLSQLQERIISGEFGQLKRVKAVTGWTRSNSYFSRNRWSGELKIDGQWVLDGTVNNPVAHALSSELFLASKQPGKIAAPKKVQAELYRAHKIESEDTSSLRIITENDVEIIFNASLCSEETFGPDITIECEHAEIIYSKYLSATIKYKDDREDEILESSDKSGNVILMLENIAECYEKNLPYRGSLEICRPFTLAVNGAFESAVLVNQVPEKNLIKNTLDDNEYTLIKDMPEILKTVDRENKLFSEINIPWSVSTDFFDLKDYKYFPQQKQTLAEQTSSKSKKGQSV